MLRYILFEKYICISAWKWPAQGTSSVPVVSAHFRSLLTTVITTLGDRAFPVVASRKWNDLPPTIKASPSLLTYRQQLKTFLFQSTLLT